MTNLRRAAAPSLLIATTMAGCLTDEVEIVAFALPQEAAQCISSMQAQEGTAVCLFLQGAQCAFVQQIDAERTTEFNGWDAEQCAPPGLTFSPDTPVRVQAFFVANTDVCTDLAFGEECPVGEGCFARYEITYRGVEEVPGGHRLNDIGAVIVEGSCDRVFLCGNGEVDADSSEQCDDGNQVAGDGCEFCIVEDGWDCSSGTCDGICGDGRRLGQENEQGGCDDGNLFNDDGCSSTCEIETGFACIGEPSVCRETCGRDGFEPAFGEGCDDNNTAENDGCSPTCTVERGWTCTGTVGSASECDPTACGDGVLVNNTAEEQCDDGNRIDDDGCNNDCQLTAVGFDCTSVLEDEDPNLPDTTCTNICGDGIFVRGEECDFDGEDGPNDPPNPENGDGCSDTCEIEAGYACPAGTDCSPVCGDNMTVGDEECDDGNIDEDDGCSEDMNGICREETGWECTGEGPSVCSTICGDSFVVMGEEACDDGTPAVTDPVDGCVACEVLDDWDCFTPLNAASTCVEQYSYMPANFNRRLNPARLELQDWVVASGTCVVDTGGPSDPPVFTGDCGLRPTSFRQSQQGQVLTLIVEVRNLTIGRTATVAVVGLRPLIISTYGQATIDTGAVLTVSGTLFDELGITPNNLTPAAARVCGNAAGDDAMEPVGGGGGIINAGGGGGGGFGGGGGAGGNGYLSLSGGDGNSARDTETLMPLVGGCSGRPGGEGIRPNASADGGAGGFAGGAIQVSAASQLLVRGLVRAGGADGESGINSSNLGSGGGGGGSGGGILLEGATVVVSPSASIVAPGGRGGEGGVRLFATMTSTPAAVGGTGGGTPGGAIEVGDSGQGGIDQGSAGGGGGGGVGRIRLNVAPNGQCDVSGAAEINPAFTTSTCGSP